MPRFDVLTATDCRLPGGTAVSTAEELEAQRRGGLTSALLHLESPLVSRTRPFNPRLRDALGRGDVALVYPDQSLSANVLLLRHPTAALGLATVDAGKLDVDHCIVLVNQVPVVDGRVVYRAHEVNAVVESVIGFRPSWSPIGPLVRREFGAAEPGQLLTADDWVNIIDVDAWSVARAPLDPTRIRIGRHSRDHWLKWPATRAATLTAYPDADDIEVRVLGGVPQALTVLGGHAPPNWRLHRFGSIHPRDFLADVDVYVYLHHEELTEAFGRNLLEAMASGAPVITDPKFRPLFGDAAWYAAPDDVAELVRQLGRDRDLYLERSRVGQAFARAQFGYERHLARLAALDDAPGPVRLRSAESQPSPRDAPETTVLFVSPNGAGMGHLTRMMAVAARLDPTWAAHFLTFSTAASIVEREGYPVDYVASRPVTGSSSAGWHQALADRLLALIDELSPSVIVIDGTEPYRGILRAMVERPEIPVVWSRRGMWRAGVSNPVLDGAEAYFDLIVEPGDAAGAFDVGATSRSSASQRVAPVTYVARTAMLGRADARRELGLPESGEIALVTLGAGNINDTDDVVRAVLDVAARHPDVVVATTNSPIALRAAGVTDAVSISVYPLARYLAAFDMAVAAAGYNSFHELLQARVPTVFVPNESTITDDQVRRATWAESAGVSLRASEHDPASVADAFAELMSPAVRARLEAGLRRLDWNDGGAEFAAEIERLVARPAGPPGSAVAERRRATYEHLEALVRQRSVTNDETRGSVARLSGAGSVRDVVKRSARRVLRRAQRALGAERSDRLLGRAPARLQRRLVTLMTGGTRRRSGKAPALNAPTGRWIPVEQAHRLSIVMLDVDAGVDLDEMIERVAHLQMVERTFVPVVLASSLDAAATFRRHGYVMEHVRRRADHEPLEAYEARRTQRLTQVRRWYRPAFVVAVHDLGDVGPSSLFARLVRGLDPT